MNPELDERIILTLSSSLAEITTDWLKFNSILEGFGATVNEGLCHEYCTGISFTGNVSGEIFIGMDGYTKLLLLPYIIAHLDLTVKHTQLAEGAMNSFVYKLAEEFSEELDLIVKISMQEPRSLNHKLVPLPQDLYRKYLMIYFLRDDEKKKYLGRLYIYLVLNKK